MTAAERANAFIAYFSEHNPNPTTELHYKTPFQLLIAVILSAQCTDKRVNIVTPALFKAFPHPEDLGATTAETIQAYIKSVSFAHSKAKYLVSMAKQLVEDFGSNVPAEPADLQKLAGVGRKTAHVVASVLYAKPTLAVDTHVFRVAKRIGIAPLNATTPLAVEKALVKHITAAYIPKAHHWLILHGRYICVARKPKCEICPITSICQYYETLQTLPEKRRQEGAQT